MTFIYFISKSNFFEKYQVKEDTFADRSLIDTQAFV